MEESMKKNIVVLTVVASLVLASALYLNAMTTNVLRVNVPFAFKVDKVALPAGTYVVRLERLTSTSPTGSAVIFQTLDGKFAVRAVSMPADSDAKSGANLTFNRYADSYFLSSVDSYGLGCQLRKSKAEKEVAAKFQKYERASIAAE